MRLNLNKQQRDEKEIILIEVQEKSTEEDFGPYGMCHVTAMRSQTVRKEEEINHIIVQNIYHLDLSLS